MNGLFEIGNDLGAFPQRWATQTRQQKHQRHDPGMDHQRANGRPPVPVRVPRLVPVQQEIGTGIRA